MQDIADGIAHLFVSIFMAFFFVSPHRSLYTLFFFSFYSTWCFPFTLQSFTSYRQRDKKTNNEENKITTNKKNGNGMKKSTENQNTIFSLSGKWKFIIVLCADDRWQLLLTLICLCLWVWARIWFVAFLQNLVHPCQFCNCELILMPFFRHPMLRLM